MKSFSYCLESGRQWGLDDYYELRSFDGKVAKYLVYDANMYPSNNFSKWSESAKLEVEIHVRERFKDKDIIIQIDDYEIDLSLDVLDVLNAQLQDLIDEDEKIVIEWDGDMSPYDYDYDFYDDNTYPCGCCPCCGCECDSPGWLDMEED